VEHQVLPVESYLLPSFPFSFFYSIFSSRSTRKEAQYPAVRTDELLEDAEASFVDPSVKAMAIREVWPGPRRATSQPATSTSREGAATASASSTEGAASATASSRGCGGR
jgi:hypothetical protein